MSPSSTQVPSHPNPKVQKVLAFAARKEALGMTFASAAELTRKAADHYRDPSLGTVNVGRQVRQVWRDIGKGCGRGNTYGKTEKGKVARGLTTARKAQVAQAAQAKKAKGASKPAAAKADKPKSTRTRKAQPAKAEAQQPEAATA